jgi:hypothetical protein
MLKVNRLIHVEAKRIIFPTFEIITSSAGKLNDRACQERNSSWQALLPYAPAVNNGCNGGRSEGQYLPPLALPLAMLGMFL